MGDALKDRKMEGDLAVKWPKLIASVYHEGDCEDADGAVADANTALAAAQDSLATLEDELSPLMEAGFNARTTK
jgi:hypothetical protein